MTGIQTAPARFFHAVEGTGPVDVYLNCSSAAACVAEAGLGDAEMGLRRIDGIEGQQGHRRLHQRTRIVQGQRATYYCPKCQINPKIGPGLMPHV